MLYNLLRNLKIALYCLSIFFVIFLVSIIMILVNSSSGGTIVSIFIVVAILSIILVYISFYILKKTRLKMLGIFNLDYTVKESFNGEDKEIIKLKKIKNASRISMKCSLENGSKVTIPDYVVASYGDNNGFEGVLNAPMGTNIVLRNFINATVGEIVNIQAFFKVGKEIFVLIKKANDSVGLISYNNLI